MSMRLKDFLPVLQACCPVYVNRKVGNVLVTYRGDAVQMCEVIEKLGINDCVVERAKHEEKGIIIDIRDFDKLEGDT